MMALEEMEKELEREIRKNKSVASSGTSGSKSSADVKKVSEDRLFNAKDGTCGIRQKGGRRRISMRRTEQTQLS